MGWFKRNLFFAIGGIVALALLGAAGYYDYASWGHNQAQFNQLTEVYNTLKGLAAQKPSPGNDKIDNIATARDQERQLRQWINQTTNYFQPIAPIPKRASGPVTSEQFAGALHRTIAQLQSEAAAANVGLPPAPFNFSFSAHMDRLTFAPGSLEPLSVQLGEVKAISELLFETGINSLDGIQRVPVPSSDDAGGPQADYLADQPVKTDLAEMVPYQVVFSGFSAEIARVLEAFAASPHGFIVTAISVQPAGAAPGPNTGAYGPNPGSLPAAPVPGKGGLQTVLNEQLLRATMTVQVVKLAPRN